jgi:RNA polymerase sigma-70 factor (ECF subfamily)
MEYLCRSNPQYRREFSSNASLAPLLLFPGAMSSTREWQSGPHDGAGWLYRSYGVAVGRWALRLTRSPSDAQDIVQEVFLIAHRRLARAEPLVNPGPWLFQVTRNVARHLWRERRRRESVQLEEAGELTDGGLDPFQSLERRVDLEQLSRALSNLSAEDRRLVDLCDLRHLSPARVSDLTGFKAQTVRVRRHRARQRMARWLRGIEPVWAVGA